MWSVWVKPSEDARPIPTLTTEDEDAALVLYEAERDVIRAGRQPGEVWLMCGQYQQARYQESWNPEYTHAVNEERET